MEPAQDIFAGKVKLDLLGKQHLRSIAVSATVLIVVALITYIRNIWLYFKAKDVIRIPREGFMDNFVEGQQNITSLVLTIAIGLVINFFLARYIMLSKDSIRNSDTTQLTAAIRQLKTYFIIISIFMILVATVVLFAVLIGLSASTR